MSLNENPSTWDRRTAGNIPYKLLEGFPKGGFGPEEATATEEYIIRAGDLLAFAEESFPVPYELAATGLFYPLRRRFPGLASLVTKKVDWEPWEAGLPADPFGAAAGADSGTYGPFIKVTVEYGTMSENDEERDPDDPQTFLEITANASGEFLSDDTTKGVWDGGDEVKTTLPRAVREVMTEWTCRWTQIPFNYFTDRLIARIRDKLGKVNEFAMSTFYGAPAETILFVGWNRQQQFTWRTDSGGQPPMIVEFKFLEKNFEAPDGVQVTHQKFYRPGKGTWEGLKIDGKRPYGTTDLDELFTGIEA